MGKYKSEICELIVGLIGFGLFVYGTNWIAGSGFVLGLWANNFGQKAKLTRLLEKTIERCKTRDSL
jgi:hypothetical protein